MTRPFRVLSVMAMILGMILVSTAQGPSGGTITGIVLDERGAPVEGAKVNAKLSDIRPESRAVRYVNSDRDGRFTIDRSSLGKYTIFAQKPEALYPDPYWAFYGNNLAPKVSLTAEKPNLAVEVRIGPKAATLEGSVIDKESGARIKAVSFVFRRAVPPNYWISTSFNFDYKVQVPSRTPITIEVSAEGYLPWTSVSLPATESPFIFEPEKHVRLDIKLTPIPKQGTSTPK